MAEYEINGIKLNVPKDILNDRIAGKLATAGYEADEAHAVQMRVQPGNRVLDLGAGLGYVAALCARIAGAGNVITIEANPELLPIIRANLDRNGLDQVTLIQGAVTGLNDAEEMIEFEKKKSFWAGQIADSDSAPEAVVPVPVLRISQLLQQHRPHVVMMDIEGAEQYLFDARWPPCVRSVMMELHPRRYPSSVIKRIVDCMSASNLTYDPGPSRGRVLCFRRVRNA